MMRFSLGEFLVPQRWARRPASGVGPVLVAILPLVLGAILLRVGVNTPALLAQERVKAQAAAPPDDLARLPADTVLFFRVELSEFWQSRTFETLQKDKEFFPKLRQRVERDIGNALGMEPTALAVLTVAQLPRAGAKPEHAIVILLTTEKTFEPATIVKAALPQAQEHQHKGKSFFTSTQVPELAFHFADKRLLVLGSPAALRRFLEAPTALGDGGVLAPALTVAQGRHPVVFAGRDSQPRTEKGKEDTLVDPQWLKPVPSLTFFTGVVDPGRKARARLAFTFPDEATAKEAVGAVRESLKQYRLFFLMMAYTTIQAHKDPDLGRVPLPLKKIADALENATAEQKGATLEVTAEAELSSEDYEIMVKGIGKAWMLTGESSGSKK